MIICIVGPTGVGKTKMSIELAIKFNGEIINGDSTQVYTEMIIGTAKVLEEEKENIPHHLFDFKSLDEEYTVYDYQIDARACVDDILSRGKTPIIVGGSNMYISSLLYNYNFKKEDNVYDLDTLSNDEMYSKLKALKLPLELDRHNRQRLIRYYAKYINNSEVLEMGGETLVYDCFIVGLTTKRDTLYNRINKRVEAMIENGLIQEVREVYKKYPLSKQLENTIGYKEMIDYFKGMPLEETISLIKQNSRNYAKRQYTWLNHKMNVKWFDTDFNNFNNTVNEVISYLETHDKH